MGKHVLQLNFPPCSNEGVFLVDDISIYDQTLGTGKCGNLQITPPGASTPTSLAVDPNFRLVLNACTIGLLPLSSCATCCPELPEGMYNIRYSVSPNTLVFVEYKILRTVKAVNRRNNLLCKIGLTPCLPDADIQAELRDLDIILDYLVSAKETVENLHQYADGMAQYKFAVQLMDKMSYNRKNC